MPGLPLEAPNILAIYLQIAQYPILARQIRRHMRDELYRRGVITSARLEQEAKEKALLSQRREGLTNPLEEEDERQWEQRLSQVRDYLTDFYFAYNLPLDLFEHIIGELLAPQSPRPGDVGLTFNPELAPLDLLLKQAAQYEALPDEQRAKVGHHLEEVIVVLTKTMISDHLPFVRVAKEWFTTADFNFIRARRIGSGKIGGKAAGMLLAWKILQKSAPHIVERVTLPRSYFVGSDVFYDFLALNGLEYLNQKYKPVEQIRAEYPQVEQAYVSSRFPDAVAGRLRDILHEVGHTPLIVRSSSLLEDNFGASFAGKYASYFCPNQGTPRENLRALTLAIRRVYASVYSPDALLYRRRMGLLDYDERMAVLLQEVQGQTYRHYFFPTLAGVAFSCSPLVWSPRLRREEGFVRMVLGLGTRAVERAGDDYARLVTLSHPALRPEVTPADIRRYSQRFVDVIDLKANVFATVALDRLLDLDYAPLRWVASVDQGDTLMPLFALGPDVSAERLVLTFDNLMQRTDAVRLLKGVLSALTQHYHVPVEIEFAIGVDAKASPPGLSLQLLQCRPQSNLHAEEVRPIPADIPASDRLFQTTRMVPRGEVNQVEYIVYVDPTAYSHMADPVQRLEVARIIGRLNKALERHTSILIGPGRWGSANLNLGVPVSYADIYNAGALVELAVEQQGIRPEPSYGTHFFQDLVETRIYPLAVYPGEPGEFLNWAFLRDAANCLASILPADAGYGECVKVIHAPAERGGRRIEIVMDGERALAYFEQVAARAVAK